jgi:D-alanyl-D-alanine carboxypeptidase
MQRLIKYSLACAISSFFATQSYGAKLVSACSMSDKSLEVIGKNIDERMPIASVSKVYTSLMAVTSFNLEHKFFTQIYVTPVGNDVFDVHLQGSRDPYFNKFKMHMIISRLNEMKVTKIRNLTFDENVKYLHETDTSRGFRAGKTYVNPLILKADMEFPTPAIVTSEFQQLTLILKSYKDSFKLAAANGIKLFNNPSFRVTKIAFLPSTQFKSNPNVQKIFVASQNIKTILKSMNWNSNNHAANQMFMAAGGEPRFKQLYYKNFQQSESDVRFVNGSGQNHDLTGHGRLYNEATCRNVLRTLHILDKAVSAQKAQLEDIMSVVGEDKGSTVGGVTYSNPLTNGSVVAKTGTVGTNIALAGVANTKQGRKFFMYNVELKSTTSKSEANLARKMISNELQKLMKANGGPIKLSYVRQNPLNDNLENYDEDVNDALYTDAIASLNSGE